MSGFLSPTLAGAKLTVDTVMKQPMRITDRIATLAGDQLILDKIFHTPGTRVTGGAMLYNQVRIEDFFVDEDRTIEQRGPGDEYPVVKRVDPTPKLAYPEDWGGKFQIEDERITRNDQEYLDDQVTQLTNTIVEKLNTRAIAELNAQAGGGENTVPGHDWSAAVSFGPPDNLSEGAELPMADLAATLLVGERERLGAKYNTLLIHPNELYSLRICYGPKLDSMLASLGLKYFSYPLLTPGIAWVVERGQVGVCGFERPLTTEAWRQPEKRTNWVQSYAVPAFAVNKPFKAKKITGLAG